MRAPRLALSLALASAAAGVLLTSAPASSCPAADSTCFSGGDRRSLPIAPGPVAQLGAAAAGTAIPCSQGAVDSTCAARLGGSQGSYSSLNNNNPAGPTACRNLAPSTWTASCPAGQVGQINMQRDYACSMQRTYLAGSTTPVLIYAEPGDYGPAYEASRDCQTPPPPPPAAPPANTVTFFLAAGGLAFGGPVSVPAGYPYAFAYYSGYGFGGSTYEFVVFTNVPMSDLEANGRAGVYAVGSGMAGAIKPGQSTTYKGWTINHASNSQTYYPTTQGSGSIGSLFLNGGTNGPGTCFDWLYTESHHVCNNGSTVQ